MDLSGKKVSVIGAGKSGIAAAELLCSEGSQVLLSDFGRIEESVVRRLESQKISVEEKGHSERVFDADLNKEYLYGTEPGKISVKLYEKLRGIQYGTEPDPYGWTDIIE